MELRGGLPGGVISSVSFRFGIYKPKFSFNLVDLDCFNTRDAKDGAGPVKAVTVDARIQKTTPFILPYAMLGLGFFFFFLFVSEHASKLILKL